MPTKPSLSQVSNLNSQRDMRTPETVYDQHKCERFPNGRPWWGWAEIQTDRRSLPGFVCELAPGDHNDPMHGAWTAPWFPTQMREQSGRRYLELNMKRLTLTWNYPLMIADNTLATKSYYQAAAKIANANGWKAPAMHEQVSFQIESILGDPPQSHKIPEAAMAGDPWLLGFTEQVNQDLADLLSGVRVVTPAVRVADALQMGEGDLSLDDKIAQAVAKALADMKAQNGAKMQKARAARKGNARTVAVG